MTKSPLRYPGGKSRAIASILAQFPDGIAEFREPFVGGGSVFLAAQATYGPAIRKYWINDLNYDLCCFWNCVKNDIDLLVASVKETKQNYSDGRALYFHLKNDTSIRSDFDRAVRFFIMNRITFSGVMDSGGYSQQAFEKRFTLSSIERLRNVASNLLDIKITYGSYESLLSIAGNDVFIFLDPPYWKATKSKLYGVNGDLHTSFDHAQFAALMRECQHRWLITYDDSPEIRKLFDFANISEWKLQYGMNNCGRTYAPAGNELFIRNY